MRALSQSFPTKDRRLLPSVIASLFASEIRTSGDEIYTSGAARILNAGRRSVQGLVRDPKQNVIDIDVRRDEVHLLCSCDVAKASGVCKHLWAVLRILDDRDILARLLELAGTSPRIVTDAIDDTKFEVVEPRKRNLPPVVTTSPPIPRWRRALDNAQQTANASDGADAGDRGARWPDGHRLIYIADIDATPQSKGLALELGTEQLSADGTWGNATKFPFDAAVWFAAPELVDRRIAEMLLGSARSSVYGQAPGSGFVIGARGLSTTLRAICETGRCRIKSKDTEYDGHTLHMDDGAPWRFALDLAHAPEGYALTGHLVRDDEAMALHQPWLIHESGFLIDGDVITEFDHGGAYALAEELRETPSLPIGEDPGELLERLYSLPRLPQLSLPSDVVIQEAHDDPIPALTIGGDAVVMQPNLVAPLALEFVYGSLRVEIGSQAPTLFDRSLSVLHHRRFTSENTALLRLRELGASEEVSLATNRRQLTVPRARMAQMALVLAEEGWQVQAFGLTYRAPTQVMATLHSGIDWFDLMGSVKFGAIEVSIADMLKVRRDGEELIELSDGSMGMMPLDFLDRLAPVLEYGEIREGGARFRRSQLALLDALLDTIPEVDVDETFSRARAELAAFDRVDAMDAPKSFRGVLREYQREGLGWLHFLRQFELGGCLADDMGLGKTVQVLALLEARRLEGAGPSLIVVPRSLVFNWLREAERFVPSLRMLDYSGPTRRADLIDAATTDVVITTYGTLRSDAATLGAMNFDYAILDEAQAIKNAGTATAKACRVLRARYRLALSGTPIENRIEELWSLLEFLNPGMMGASANFAMLARGGPVYATEDDATANHSMLARALRPIILRRKKEQVATELPPRVEQTLEVELSPPQRRFYESLRVHFQQSVLERVSRDGLQRSRMHILEALLRLRQAACHPALVDKTRGDEPCAKLDALIPSLQEVAAEGHKSLVFSQFTSFLALVRERLDAEGIKYEYLDGRTRDRAARVDRFQNDVDCPVFLISLKAGGHGLNLTAADYVFLLDPWWNPAVEAQAIDRAHRIGQTRHVIATRLIAADTIESKILELQESKRALADAILTADKGVLSSIGRDELELLLG